MTQTLAIFYGAYRNLNSKKLFWVALVISALAVVAFACVGINERGLNVLFWQFDTPGMTAETMPPALFYKYLFVYVGIGFWLSWLATILALVSTAGIFPDLITSGSIDLLVSKPIGRLRLFLTEYAGGLLFVMLQVAIFSVASFLVIGLRGGVWEPGLFVAIPLVVCFFSYLFAVCVLLGVLTRSTVAALLLTLLFWFFVYAIGAAENSVLMFKTMQSRRVGFGQVRAESARGRPPAAKSSDRAKPPEPQVGEDDNEDDQQRTNNTLEVAHRVLYDVKTVLPKTSETISLLGRLLIDLAELPQQAQQPQNAYQEQVKAAQEEFAETIRSRSVAWVVGTSLGFEALMLAAAAWLFCRQDY